MKLNFESTEKLNVLLFNKYLTKRRKNVTSKFDGLF